VFVAAVFVAVNVAVLPAAAVLIAASPVVGLKVKLALDPTLVAALK